MSPTASLSKSLLVLCVDMILLALTDTTGNIGLFAVEYSCKIIHALSHSVLLIVCLYHA